MSGKTIGYIRVSTTDQNPDRQLEGINLDKRFIEYASGKTRDRPQLAAMLEYVRDDDTLIVHSMDRLARNLSDLRNIVSELVKKNIEVKFIKENLNFTSKDNAMSNLLLNLMGSFAEFEYSFIRERQLEGIRIAKLKGRFKGGVHKLKTNDIERLRETMKTRKSKTLIADEFGISRNTLYKYLKNHQIAVG